MTTITWALDAVEGAPEYTGRALRQTMSPFLTGTTDARPLGARSGVRIGTPASTVSTSSFDWTVGVHSGVLDLQASATAGPYCYAVTVAETGTITAAHATLGRKDILYVQINDPGESDGSTTPETIVGYLAGTASGSPVVPTTPDRAMVIGTITVPASGGGDPSVAWSAPYTAAAGGIIPVRSDTERDALAAAYDATASNPLILWHIADERLTTSVDGSAWEEVANLSDMDSSLQTYVPTLTADTTNPNLGSGGDFAQTGRYWLLPGGMVHAEVLLRFGSSGASAGSGTYEVSLPVAADLTYHPASTLTAAAPPIGDAALRDDSNVGASTVAGVQVASSTTVRIVPIAGDTGKLMSNSVPWTWAAGDIIALTVEYRAA